VDNPTDDWKEKKKCVFGYGLAITADIVSLDNVYYNIGKVYN